MPTARAHDVVGAPVRWEQHRVGWTRHDGPPPGRRVGQFEHRLRYADGLPIYIEDHVIVHSTADPIPGTAAKRIRACGLQTRPARHVGTVSLEVFKM